MGIHTRPGLRRLGLMLACMVVAMSGSGIVGGGGGGGRGWGMGVIGVNAEEPGGGEGSGSGKEKQQVVFGGEKWGHGGGGGGGAGEKSWSLEEIYEELQECPIVHKLNSQLIESATPSDSQGQGQELSSWTHTLFSYLFPLSPAGNSLLATAYISGPPNFLLALVPPDIDPSRLSIMVAFAVGGLLGDTLLHLVPGSFGLGGEEGGGGSGSGVRGGVEFVVKSDRRNLLVGTMIMVGFAVFVAMDKCLRIAGMGRGGGRGHSHSHSHSHSHAVEDTAASTTSLPRPSDTSLRNRKPSSPNEKDPSSPPSSAPPPPQEIKMSSYLNIIADFSHNITDGLAMSAAFYASPTIGATTMIGVFFHEIPHEVGDFALLVQSGFTKWQAMGAQFVTAIGAFLGTGIGIAIQSWAARDKAAGAGAMGGGGVPWNGGIWESGLTGGDLVLPFTAGTFLYVGFSAVPELLEVDERAGRGAEVRRSLGQFTAMAAGFAIMFFVS